MLRRTLIASLTRLASLGLSVLPVVSLLPLVFAPGTTAARQPARQSTRQPVGIAYWDLDRLYDTLPSPFYNDDDHTPGGRLRWTTERYMRKVRQTAAVIDSMALPIVALWGVENEAVVRDIVRTCRGDYSYLHRTLDALDGMDFALLYYGDLFFPLRAEAGRRHLYIECLLPRPDAGACDTLGLVLCADERMAEWVAGDLRTERPGVKPIVLGRAGKRLEAACGMCDATARAAAAGRGNVRRRGGWLMRDCIVADTALRMTGGDVFLRRYLVDPKNGMPLRTYDGTHYRGGYGPALPVYAYIE